jgi:hypothetical protein
MLGQRKHSLTQELSTTSEALVEKYLLDISRNGIKQNQETEGFIVPYPENYPIHISSSPPVKRVVYTANTKSMANPMVMRISGNTGTVFVITKNGEEERSTFYVGVVKNVSYDSLVLNISDNNGIPIDINLPISDKVQPPYKGQRVFVTTGNNRITSLESL